MPCKACNQYNQINGTAECAFTGDQTTKLNESPSWNGLNWNCHTMLALRESADEHNLVTVDQENHIATLPYQSDSDGIGFIVITWYKQRGRTERAVFISDSCVRTITEQDALTCLKQLEGTDCS